MGSAAGRVLRRWGSVAGFFAAGVAAVWLLMPRTPPKLAHSSVLNTVFDTRWMIGVARVTIVVAAVYAVTSAGVRVTRGQWLSKAGPLEAETAVQDVADDRERLRGQLTEAQAIIKEFAVDELEVAPATNVADTEAENADISEGGAPDGAQGH